MRGLKHLLCTKVYRRPYVAPYVGAWIETYCRSGEDVAVNVAPYVGAWIETKYVQFVEMCRSRTLRGCVD